MTTRDAGAVADAPEPTRRRSPQSRALLVLWAVVCVLGAAGSLVMAFLFGTDDPTQRYEGEPLTWVQALIAAAVAFLAVDANLTTRRWPLPVSVAGAVLWLIGWGII